MSSKKINYPFLMLGDKKDCKYVLIIGGNLLFPLKKKPTKEFMSNQKKALGLNMRILKIYETL